MTPPRSIQAPCLLVLFTLHAVMACGAEPLAARIDRLIEAAQIGPVAALATDAEFLRRASLDLHGVIPASTEARAFIDDPNPTKREALIDRLVSSPRFAVHMATVFDVMLMERRPDKHVTTVEWQKFLQAAFEKNLPYDQLVREILSGDGVDPNLRPAAKFFLDREAEPHLMTRDIGRILFGVDLQCAQCHDHPLVEHYLQTDYFGLFAFVNRTVLFTDEAKKSYLGEKSDGDASYKSVFTQDAGLIRPQLPGDNEIDEPRFRQGEDYAIAPLPNVRPVPKFSRRMKLAELATNGANRQFNLNIANRLWGLMMGRGLVHPVDLHHPLNPPSHPEVLELVADEFVAMKYDVRRLLRELAVSKTYQRSIDPPETNLESQIASVAERLPVLKADYDRLQSVASESRKLAEAAQTEFKAARTAIGPAETAWRATEAEVAKAKKPLDDSQVAVLKSQRETAAKQAAVSAINEAAQKSNEAAKLLPNDKEIAAAVATFKAKQEQFGAELAAAQKAVNDLLAAQPPLQAKLTESYVPADAAFAAYSESRKPVDAAKSKLISAWNRHKADAMVAFNRKQQLDACQTLMAYQASVGNVAKMHASIESVKGELTAAIQAAEQQQTELSKGATAVAEIEKSAVSAEKSLSDAQTKLDAKQTVVQTVSEAIAKTDAALQLLPDDADLKAAAQKLKDRLEPLKTEAESLKQAKAGQDAAVKEVRSKLAALKQGLATATAEMASRQQLVTAKTNAVNQATSMAREAESSIAAVQQQLINLRTIAAAIRPIKQLTPEEIGWAAIQATGVLDSQRAAADAEVEKTMPKASASGDLAKARDWKVEQQLHEQMRGNVAPFVTLYAASAGQSQEDFFATPDQALFVANGGTLIGWASGGQLSQRLMALTEPKAFAEELYLATLTRRPTDVEVNEATEFLASRAADRPGATRDLIWSLVSSVEFRFNH